MPFNVKLGESGRLEYQIVVENSANGENPSTINVPNYNSGMNENPETTIPLVVDKHIKNPFIIPGLKKVQIDSQLNPNYNFDSFIEGDCNRLARSAGFAVAEKPAGTSFNPLGIVGRCWSWKNTSRSGYRKRNQRNDFRIKRFYMYHQNDLPINLLMH